MGVLPGLIMEDVPRTIIGLALLAVLVWVYRPLFKRHLKAVIKEEQQKPVIGLGGNLSDRTITNNIYGAHNQLLSVTGNVTGTTISRNRSNNDCEIIEFIVDSNLLKITAKELINTSFGSTTYALYYSWNEGKQKIFDKIEGFSLEFYHMDIDTDDKDELIIEYHCGAHTKVMQIYKISAAKKPKLIPSAIIGSDWPDIYWQLGKKNEGTIIMAKHRNWAGNPIDDNPIIDTYHVINGNCKKLNSQQKKTISDAI